MPAVNEINNSSSPQWGRKRYTYDAPLVNDRVSDITSESKVAGYGGLIHTFNRPYVPPSPYPDGTPINPLLARKAGSTPRVLPYVMAFESWINNAKRVFGIFMPGSRPGR